MPHERLYQYSSLGLDFSTCLQSHTILLQFLIKNIAKLGFNWSLTYLQRNCHKYHVYKIYILDYVSTYLISKTRFFYCCACNCCTPLNVPCRLNITHCFFYNWRLWFSYISMLPQCLLNFLLHCSKKSCAFKIQNLSVTYWKFISR